MEYRDYKDEELCGFILAAKKSTYIGDGKKSDSTRLNSKDLKYQEGNFYYHDTYFGSNDFSGQEVVYYKERPVWTMVYFGKNLRPDWITGGEIGRMLKESLTKMYDGGSFLGDFFHVKGNLRYEDGNKGDFRYFNGAEKIFKEGIPVYELAYTGGVLE